MHRVVLADTNRWDSIKTAVNGSGMGRISSQNDPTPNGVSQAKWDHVIGVFSSPGVLLPQYAGANGHVALANDIFNSFVTYPNALVTVDELNSASVNLIALTAGYLGSAYNNWWGAYVVNGTSVSYSNLSYAIDNLLINNCRIMLEFYPTYSGYMASGTTAAARDTWLGNFYRGNASGFGDRLAWLMTRKGTSFPNSLSIIQPVLGAGDAHLNASTETKKAQMLDRMMYVFMTKSGFPSLGRQPNNGGFGSFKWDSSAAGQASVATRDQTWVDSYNWYSISGSYTSSRLGQVT
jgi:hypothetical protein